MKASACPRVDCIGKRPSNHKNSVLVVVQINILPRMGSYDFSIYKHSLFAILHITLLIVMCIE